MLDRGYLAVDGDHLRPCGPAAVIVHVLTGTARWLSIVNGSPAGVCGSVLVDGPAGSLALVPRTDRTFAVLALPVGTSGDSVVGGSVLPYLDATVPGVVVLNRAAGDRDGSLVISRDPAGEWWLGEDGRSVRPASRKAASSAIGALTAG